MQKLLTTASFFLIAICFLVLLPSPTYAFPTQINYQGRAFDANNKFIGDGCYPVSIKIGRFSNKVVAPTNGKGSYTQSDLSKPGVEYPLPANKILNTHPSNKCNTGEVYVSNGLFNVILNLETFDARFLSSTLPFYGVSINFNSKGWSKWQPLVEDNWYYPANQDNSPQRKYYLSAHQDPDPRKSWGLWTNHGFLAQGGLGAPIMWDSENTAFRVDPNGITSINTIYINGDKKLYFGDYNAAKDEGTTGEYIYSQRSAPYPLVIATGWTDRLKITSEGNNSKVEIVPPTSLCLGGECRNTWPSVPNIQSGTTSTQNTHGGGELVFTIAFPKPFSTIPNVTATPICYKGTTGGATCKETYTTGSDGGAAADTQMSHIQITDLTKTGFKVHFKSDGYGGSRWDFGVSWIAIGN